MILQADYNFLAYGRFTEQDQVLVVFNAGRDTMERTIRVRDMGITTDDNLIQLMMTDRDGYHTDAVVYQMQRYDVTLTLPPNSAIVLRALRRSEDAALPEEENGSEENVYTAWKEYT